MTHTTLTLKSLIHHFVDSNELHLAECALTLYNSKYASSIDDLLSIVTPKDTLYVLLNQSIPPKVIEKEEQKEKLPIVKLVDKPINNIHIYDQKLDKNNIQVVDYSHNMSEDKLTRMLNKLNDGQKILLVTLALANKSLENGEIIKFAQRDSSYLGLDQDKRWVRGENETRAKMSSSICNSLNRYKLNGIVTAIKRPNCNAVYTLSERGKKLAELLCKKYNIPLPSNPPNLSSLCA
jgi:hypothetical protein